MSQIRARIMKCMIILGFTTLAVSAATAGTGSAVSSATNIDVRPPVLNLTDPPPNTVLQAGQTFEFNWTVSDDNPSAAPNSNAAEVYFRSEAADSQAFTPGFGSHVWQWTIPDTTAGSVHLVVRSSDAFGNTTIESAAGFTILSSATSVPQADRAPAFEPVAPNPFNPSTLLQFNLPQAGRIRVSVHDARGYLVKTLLNSRQSAGPLTTRWDGTDSHGRRQAGGTYFFRLEYPSGARSVLEVRKGLLLP